MVSADNAPWSSRFERAASIVKRGGVIGFPTDTVYGIGCDYQNPTAVAMVYARKARPQQKPLIILASDFAMLEPFLDRADALVLAAVQRFWPGPVTLVVKRPLAIPAYVTGGLDTVGLRIPDDLFCRGLLRATGPLATTSANIAGEQPFTGGETSAMPTVDAFFENGPTRHGQSSSVIDLYVRPPQMLREGALTQQGFDEWYATL